MNNYKKKAVYQAIANLLMWMNVPIVLGIAELIKGTDLKTPFPTAELLKLVEPAQLFIFLAAGVLYFAIFAGIRHKSKKKDEQDRAAFFADLGFDEMTSALYSFGSILLVCSIIGTQHWYGIAAMLCYFVGYFLKPDDEVANPAVNTDAAR